MRPTNVDGPRISRAHAKNFLVPAKSFDTEPNELPLIREGCAMRALISVDQELFSPGQNRDVA